MGSLMAGWDSPVLDPKRVLSERNRSFTKEEIETFRRLHKESLQQQQKKRQEQHETVVSKGIEAKKPEASSDSTQLIFPGAEYLVDVEKAENISDWWTRSNWAFLNEPPLEEDTDDRPSHGYASQFHVAKLANTKSMCAN